MPVKRTKTVSATNERPKRATRHNAALAAAEIAPIASTELSQDPINSQLDDDLANVPKGQVEHTINLKSAHSPLRDAPRATKPAARKKTVRKAKQTTETAAQRQAVDDLKARMRAQQHAINSPVATSETQTNPSPVKTAAQLVDEAVAHSHTPAQSPANNTPRSRVASAVDALANFKRRQRQPSLLHMVQAQHSVANTAAGVDEISLANDLTDFMPHDESTPVQIARVARDAVVVSPVRNNVIDDEEDLYGYTPPAQTARKRKSDEMEEASIVQVPRSPSVETSSDKRRRNESLPMHIEDEIDQEQALVVPSTEQQVSSPRHSTPQRQNLSDTYADPLSSSPLAPDIVPAAVERPRATASRPMRGAAAAKDPQPLTTAALRALLPKRRDKSDTSHYEVPSSDVPEDDSRVSNETARKVSRQRQNGKPVPKRSRAKHTRSKVAEKTTATTKRAFRGEDKENRSSPVPLSLASSPPPPNHEDTAPVDDLSSDTNSVVSRSTIVLNNRVKQDGASRTNARHDKTRSGTSNKRARARTKGDQATSTDQVGERNTSSNLDAIREKFRLVDEYEMEFESAPSSFSGLGRADNLEPESENSAGAGAEEYADGHAGRDGRTSGGNGESRIRVGTRRGKVSHKVDLRHSSGSEWR